VRKGRANTASPGSRWAATDAQCRHPHLEQFAYVGVFSSGLIEGSRVQIRMPGAPQRPGAPAASAPPAPRLGPTADEWATLHAAKLADATLRKGLMFWFATGKDDFLFTTTQATVTFRSTGHARSSRPIARTRG
jgi:hypothetical protein